MGKANGKHHPRLHIHQQRYKRPILTPADHPSINSASDSQTRQRNFFYRKPNPSFQQTSPPPKKIPQSHSPSKRIQTSRQPLRETITIPGPPPALTKPPQLQTYHPRPSNPTSTTALTKTLSPQLQTVAWTGHGWSSIERKIIPNANLISMMEMCRCKGVFEILC